MVAVAFQKFGRFIPKFLVKLPSVLLRYISDVIKADKIIVSFCNSTKIYFTILAELVFLRGVYIKIIKVL